MKLSLDIFISHGLLPVLDPQGIFLQSSYSQVRTWSSWEESHNNLGAILRRWSQEFLTLMLVQA